MTNDPTNPPGDDDKTQIAPPVEDRTEIAPQPVETGRVTTPPPVPPAAPMPDATPLPGESPVVQVPIGTLINNNYEIKELINAGGMGEVFRGENVFTGDAVAIKIVLQSLAHDEKVAALFMREAKVLCQLSDQAIVRYYNFVRDADLDRFCLIMEFIEGTALSDHIRDIAPLTLPQATGLMRRVAAGLERAHEMDVVHRDLSPDNVMLRDGSVDNAVLIDFGIAKSAEMTENTLHGQLAGKFKYISPEQLGHFGGEIGPRTDIYGLGLLMAAALRGKPLDMGSSIVEAVNARREVPDLSDIDAALRPLLMHMLEPDPADRPASMADVIAMLDDPGQISSHNPAPVSAVVPGLRQPPGRTASPSIPPVDSMSGTPFGQTTGLDRPAPEPASAPRGDGAFRWLLVLLVFGGIGAFFAWQQGLIGSPRPAVLEPTLPIATDGSDDPWSSTREGFLAAWSDEPCIYATRLQAGPNSGTIAAFSSTRGAFDQLLDTYDETFNVRPTLSERRTTAEQCPALALADALRNPDAAPPVLTLDTALMQSGGTTVGRLSDRRGRPTWLAWVSDKGGVYNLTGRLTEQGDGSATFSFGLSAEEGAGETPQILIALSSDSPLIAAAASADGTSAATLLPLIEAEITGRNDTKAGLAIAGFDLRP
jgi:serine/threonine-protein kinase